MTNEILPKHYEINNHKREIEPENREICENIYSCVIYLHEFNFK